MNLVSKFLSNKHENGRKMTTKYKIPALIMLCWITALASMNIGAAETKTSDTPTRINADKLQFDYEEKVAYLRGSVVVRDTKGVLKADNATIYFTKDKNKKKKDSTTPDVGNFTRIVAVGNVKMSSSDKNIIVVSEKAVWNKKDNTIVLTGGPPMVKQGPAYIKAERIVFDISTQNIDFKPSPEMVFEVSATEKNKFFE